MLYIPTRLREFPQDPAGWPVGLGDAYSGHDIAISRAELLGHAATVGTTQLFRGGYRRQLKEIAWRMQMLDWYLEETPRAAGGHYFKAHRGLAELDPSEAVGISYYLGITVCSALAEKALGAVATVHAEKLVQLLGGQRTQYGCRPDLVGIIRHTGIYQAPNYGRYRKAFLQGILLEAKSSLGGYRKSVLERGKNQLINSVPEIRSLVPRGSQDVASIAYFATKNRRGDRVLRCDLLDPPIEDDSIPYELTRTAYSGLVLAAQLLPFAHLIWTANRPDYVRSAARHARYITASIPGSDVSIGLPARLVVELSEITKPLLNRTDPVGWGEKIWSLLDGEQDIPADWMGRPEDQAILNSGLVFDIPQSDLRSQGRG